MVLSIIGSVFVNPVSSENPLTEEKKDESWIGWKTYLIGTIGVLYLLNRQGYLKYHEKSLGTHLSEFGAHTLAEVQAKGFKTVASEYGTTAKNFASTKYAEVSEKGLRATASEYGTPIYNFASAKYAEVSEKGLRATVSEYGTPVYNYASTKFAEISQTDFRNVASGYLTSAKDLFASKIPSNVPVAK